jgi:hypothetical protein
MAKADQRFAELVGIGFGAGEGVREVEIGEGKENANDGPLSLDGRRS